MVYQVNRNIALYCLYKSHACILSLSAIRNQIAISFSYSLSFQINFFPDIKISFGSTASNIGIPNMAAVLVPTSTFPGTHGTFQEVDGAVVKWGLLLATDFVISESE